MRIFGTVWTVGCCGSVAQNFLFPSWDTSLLRFKDKTEKLGAMVDTFMWNDSTDMPHSENPLGAFAGIHQFVVPLIQGRI